MQTQYSSEYTTPARTHQHQHAASDSKRHSGGMHRQSKSSQRGSNAAASTNNKDGAVDPRRYKTRLCRSWSTKGFCQYEQVCMFAHGNHELRTVELNVKDDLLTEASIHNYRRRLAVEQGTTYVPPKPMPHAARQSKSPQPHNSGSASGCVTPRAASHDAECEVYAQDQDYSNEYSPEYSSNDYTNEDCSAAPMVDTFESRFKRCSSEMSTGSGEPIQVYVHDPYCFSGGYYRTAQTRV